MEGGAAVDFVQGDRNVRFESSLGNDVAVAIDFVITEPINDDFQIIVNVLAKRIIAPDEIIGKACDVSVRMEIASLERRTWTGICYRLLGGSPTTRGYRQYQVLLLPEAHRLRYRTNSKIWQKMSSTDVVQALFAEHGLTTPIIRVNNPPNKEVFSQQRNESDWDYLLRRLQADGLFFYYDVTGGAKGSVCAKHTMIICDDATGYSDGDMPKVRFAAGSAAEPHITRLERSRRYIPGKATISEYNFKTPGAIPSGSTPSLVKLPGNAQSESFLATAIGGYGSGDASDEINNKSAELASKLYMKACEAEYETNEGESDERTLRPGYRFTPYDITNPGAGFVQLVISEIVHKASHGSYEADGKDAPDYSNTFIALPATTPATPHKTVPKPIMHGLDVAIVVGPAGEEIFTDEFGRVRIMFTRDREAKKTDADSCWVRAAQNWAGVSYGGLILPRVGMHVLVGYESGDMDRPIIVGHMPNPAQKPAYVLPDNKTRSTFRSQTYKQPGGFNEWTMEDATGAERYFFHAQKDMATRVLNNRTARVDQHDVYSVGGNRAVEVAKNQKHEIGGSLHTTVGGTGAAALGALAGVAGLAGLTSTMLQQAGGSDAGIGGFAASIGGSLLGFLSGGGLGSRQGVVAGSPPGNDAGEALAKAGDGMGQDVGSVLPIGGVMNTIVSLFKSDSVGVAHAEQIGQAKVVNVGVSFATNIGKTHTLVVGETSETKIGKQHALIVGETSHYQVTKGLKIESGEATEVLSGKTMVIDGGDVLEITAKQRIILKVNNARVQIEGEMVIVDSPLTTIVKGAAGQHTYGPGPILYMPAHVPGGAPPPPPPPPPCLKRMSQGQSAFVVM